MNETLAAVEKYFRIISDSGCKPTDLHKWEFEFFDAEFARLKTLCAGLVEEGFTFEKVFWNRDPGYQVKGWRVRISEIKKHSAQSMFNNKALFEKHGLTQDRALLIMCTPKNVPKRIKNNKRWQDNWEKQVAEEQRDLSKPPEKIPTPELDQFFAGAETSPQEPVKGWLQFVKLVLNGKYFFLTDMRPGPSDDGLKVNLPPGEYELQVSAFVGEREKRIARLRGIQKGVKPILGKEIGKVSTDCAMLGIYDRKNFQSLLRQGSEVFYEWGEAAMDIVSKPYGILVQSLKKSAILPVVTSGFGDGEYPVFELTRDGKRVGFEVEFIAEGKR